jgi:excisionase family DNA binding protein
MKGWLKPKAAAEYCDIGERTLRKWLKEDGLRSSKIRGTTLIKVKWMDQFLEQRELDHGNGVDRIVSEVCKELEL